MRDNKKHGRPAMIDDQELEENEEPVENPHQKRKKIMILLLPLLIVIGISVAVYFTLNNDYDSLSGSYNIVQYNKDNTEDITVFYDLPEFKASVKGNNGNHELRLKITLELSSIEDLKMLEILAPKLQDAMLSHIIELRFDEVSGSQGLYWLKEELLYRFNLVSAPVKIKNLNFSVFELQK